MGTRSAGALGDAEPHFSAVPPILQGADPCKSHSEPGLTWKSLVRMVGKQNEALEAPGPGDAKLQPSLPRLKGLGFPKQLKNPCLIKSGLLGRTSKGCCQGQGKGMGLQPR